MKPIVLVVDDSDIQRQLIGNLLLQAGAFDIRFAWDGQDACDYLEKSPADLVLTDLLMPGIDGLALIELLRTRHADVPVILVTAHGNEDIAQAALCHGAVSYVPKAELTERLLNTVHAVARRVQFDQRKLHIPRHIGPICWEHLLPADLDAIEPVIEQVHETLIAAGAGDRITRVGTCVAVAEALSNAVLHGNLEITHEEMQQATLLDPQSGLSRLVQQRRNTPGLAERRATLKVEVSAERSMFTIRDERPRPSAASDIAVHTDGFLERGHGRGLILMQALTDQLLVHPDANEVVLVAKQNCATYD